MDDNERIYHVTELVSILEYDECVKSDLTPDIGNLKLEYKKFPKYVYTKQQSFKEYGMYIDYLFRKMVYSFPDVQVKTFEPEPAQSILEDLLLSNPDNTDYDEYIESLTKYINVEVAWTSVVYHSYKISSLHFENEIYTKQEVNRFFMYYKKLCREMNEKWNSFGLNNVQFNRGFIYNNIQGHPDCIATLDFDDIKGTVVLDIKTTQKFEQIRSDSVLQVLTYAAIINKLHSEHKCELNVTYMGFIFPLQKDIVIYDISTWNYLPFLDIIVKLKDLCE